MSNLNPILSGGFGATVVTVVGLFFKYRDKWRIGRAADEKTAITQLKAENARAQKRADDAETATDEAKRQRDIDVAKIRGERDWNADVRAAYRGILIEKGYAELADKVLDGLQRQYEIDQGTPKTIRARRDDDG